MYRSTAGTQRPQSLRAHLVPTQPAHYQTELLGGTGTACVSHSAIVMLCNPKSDVISSGALAGPTRCLTTVERASTSAYVVPSLRAAAQRWHGHDRSPRVDTVC